MGVKIIITGAKPIDKLHIAKQLIEVNDNLSIAPTFTSDRRYENVVSDNYIYYMDLEKVNLAFKNNVILYINTDVNISHGITLDNFYNNDIFVMDLEDFNNISERNITGQDLLIVWVDTKHYEEKNERLKDITEAKYLEERIQTIPYLYFLDNTVEEIVNVINDYLEGDEEQKLVICQENS